VGFKFLFAQGWPCCFLTGISTPPNHQVHVISRRLYSGWLRPGSASAHVCSGLLTHLTRNRQLLSRSLKSPPFPARGPKSVPTARSFLDSYPSLHLFIYRTFCVLLRLFNSVLYILPKATYSINDRFPLAFIYLLTHLLLHISPIFHLSSHLSSHLSFPLFSLSNPL